MTREPFAVLGAAVLGGGLLLVVEPAVGLVALAGTGAALLLQRRPRRAMAALLAALGAVTGVAGVTQGRWLLVVGGAMVATAGAAAAVRSARWPAPRRGDRDRGQRAPGTRGESRGRGSAADTWAALDRGEDPTA